MCDNFKDSIINGVAFICVTCKRWEEGVGKGIIDSDGDQLCSRSKVCHGPLSGGDFGEYDGPLRGCMTKFCHACGAESTKAIAPKGVYNKIGVCDECLKMLRGLTPSMPGRKIIFTTAKRAGEDKYEVNS